MRRSVLGVVLAALLAHGAPALGASVEIRERTGYLVYRAAPGERNDVVIAAGREKAMRGHEFVHFSVEDDVPIEPGSGCRRAHVGVRPFVRCDVDLFGAVRVVVRLGNRDDRARITGDFESARIDGERGEDVLVGGVGDDTLLGGLGTDLLIGGEGTDELMAGGFGTSRDVTADRLRGGPGSDLLIGSAGPNLMQPGTGVDEVIAYRGRDIIAAKDGTIEQVHCGRGEDDASTDDFDYPLSCERHNPYSAPSPVPLQLIAAAGERRATLLLGCREAHPAGCSGTAQLEAGDRPLSEELAFTGANRHRQVIVADTLEPMPGSFADVAIRIRARDATGAPTDDRYPVPALLVGMPFVGVRR